MLFRATFIAAATVTAAIGSASPAHADDQSYLDSLHRNNVGRGIMNPPTVVALGHFMCDRIREGTPVKATVTFDDWLARYPKSQE
jgi:Protein of unknown function (DUF732)